MLVAGSRNIFSKFNKLCRVAECVMLNENIRFYAEFR
jgi:hypothetical protein